MREAEDLTWDTETSLLFCFWGVPFAPCASLPGCVTHQPRTSEQLWQHRLRAGGGQGLLVRRR